MKTSQIKSLIDKVDNQHFIEKNGNLQKKLQEDRKQISDIRYRDILLEKQLEGVKQKKIE